MMLFACELMGRWVASRVDWVDNGTLLGQLNSSIHCEASTGNSVLLSHVESRVSDTPHRRSNIPG